MINGGSWGGKRTAVTKVLGSTVATLGMVPAGHDAQAQHYHRHHHHHQVAPVYAAPVARDGAGHLVDSRGHHVDQYGRHTGVVGVYANGAYAPPVVASPQIFTGPTAYGSTGYGVAGNWNPSVASPNMVALPANNIPPDAIPGSPIGGYGKILITNPVDSGGDVNYVLNGNSYAIQPGQTQSLENDRVWTIDFASGGPRGGVRYTLSPGQFKFVVKEAGWELVRAANQSVNPAQAQPAPIPPAPLPMLDNGISSPAPAPFNPPPK